MGTSSTTPSPSDQMPRAVELFVPGRVCLFGEHSDWAGSFRRFNSALTKGYTIVCGTNQGIYARATPEAHKFCLSTVTDHGEHHHFECAMDPSVLLEHAQTGNFWSYACGVAYKIATDYRVGGLNVQNYKTDLPMGKGLSSSAAYCVLVARAFSHVYDLKMTTRGEMEYAYQGEITTPSRCGRMDQACAYGSRPVLLTYDGELVEVSELEVATELHLVIVDLAAAKSTTRILQDLQVAYPYPQNEVQEAVVELLGPTNERISGEAIGALEQGDNNRIGQLMREAQASFDAAGGAACPTELIAPVLHQVLAHEPLAEHILGCKGVGSGGDGTAQFLCKDSAALEQVVSILNKDFPDMMTLPLVVAGGRRVRRGVVLAAGFNPGFFPASKCVKPELFPIIDHDGMAKPAVLINVEQMVDAGIEQIFIVIQQEDHDSYKRLFHEEISPQNFHKLDVTAQRYARKILEVVHLSSCLATCGC